MTNRTPTECTGADIGRLAQRLLESGSVNDELIRQYATIHPALPVLESTGKLNSWFVPILVGDRMAAFFQFLPDGTFMRFSSFQHKAGDLAGCPPATDWLDLNRIQARAEIQRQSDETSNKPFFTYDRSPDRLVWAVPLTNAHGEVRLIYVVGEMVYTPTPEGTFG
jgi:hypothetical protein